MTGSAAAGLGVYLLTEHIFSFLLTPSSSFLNLAWVYFGEVRRNEQGSMQSFFPPSLCHTSPKTPFGLVLAARKQRGFDLSIDGFICHPFRGYLGFGAFTLDKLLPHLIFLETLPGPSFS